MREIVVVSGKGGTGKTSLTAAFAHLARSKVVCDLDVDAPDLHILLRPEDHRQEDFVSGFEAVIDPDACTGCGICLGMCRFNAIIETSEGKKSRCRVDPLRCEGCKVCATFCPHGAVRFEPRHCGRWFVGETRFGPMVHARLFPGQENSGRLVGLIRKEARILAEERGLDLILSDGAPGIGCPVISSLTGASLAVAVTEPTPSGLHDLSRLGELCGHFSLPLAVVVNKCDLNPDTASAIREHCDRCGFRVVGELPHDRSVTRAMNRGLTVTEATDSDFAREAALIWERIRSLSIDPPASFSTLKPGPAAHVTEDFPR